MEFSEPNKLSESNSNCYETVFECIKSSHENCEISSQINSENLNSNFIKNCDNISNPKPGLVNSDDEEGLLEEFIIPENSYEKSSTELDIFQKNKLTNIITHSSEENEDLLNNRDNLEYLEDLNDNESDADEYQIVDGIHVTGDTESQEEAPLVETVFQDEQSIHQILKYQQFPILENSINDLNIKDINNKDINKTNKNLFYYIIKHPEKENLATIAPNITINKIVKTNPRSLLKSSYSYLEKTPEKQKPPIQKIEKKFPKNKETNQARVFHNFIAKTTIIHAPVRQERLPRKQTIKPVERTDEEIIVQEVVISSNGHIKASDYNKLKPTIAMEAEEVVHLSDSDEDYDPKREHKRKKKHKRRKSKVPQIIISDSEDETSDENIVQIDLSTDSGEESNKNETEDNHIESNKNKSENDLNSNKVDVVSGGKSIKKKRGRPPKRPNSNTEESNITDESSSSKKQRRSTDDSLESNETNTNKEEITLNENVQNIKTKWKCEKCPKTFPSQGSLKSHMQYHKYHEPNIKHKTTYEQKSVKISDALSKYICTVCKDVFKNNFLLTKHIKEHKPAKKIECIICKKIFADKSQLANHKRSHVKEQMFKSTTLPKHSPKGTNSLRYSRNTTTLKCSVCSKVFSSELLLNTHLKTHKFFTCTTCATNFISKLALEDHIRHNCVKQLKTTKKTNVKNNINQSVIIINSSPQENKKNLSNKTLLHCDSCSETFGTYTALFNHKVIEHGLKTPDKNIKKENLNKVSLRKESGKYCGVPASTKLRTAFFTTKSVTNK